MNALERAFYNFLLEVLHNGATDLEWTYAVDVIHNCGTVFGFQCLRVMAKCQNRQLASGDYWRFKVL